MKNEEESKEKIQRSSSSTSEVLESVDLTLRATTSTEPHVLDTRTSETDCSSRTSRNESKNLKKVTRNPPIISEILDRILDNAHQEATSSERTVSEHFHDKRPSYHGTASQPNLGTPKADVAVYRSIGTGIINSTSAMHNENFAKKVNSKMSKHRIPPSYSTVLKLAVPLPPYDSRTFPSVPFITRQPPPSYAEVHGWDDSPSIVSSDSFSLGPNPGYVRCPRCRTIVVSDIHSERSNLTYITSLILCLCMCWPCCLLPFCVKSCRNTYHFCPTCHYYLGVYRPC